MRLQIHSLVLPPRQFFGIYKLEEKAKQHANWIKEEDPKHANHIRVYKVIYEE